MRLALPIILLISFASGFGLRAIEAPGWDNPALQVQGEPIMATHDAYLWLVGANGVGAEAGSPMSRLARMTSDVCGVPLGVAAFWIPAVAGGLVSVVVALWGWLLGGWPVALGAGLVGGVAPGFWYRTRLGYYDTDIVTLLVPLVVGLLLARCVKGGE